MSWSLNHYSYYDLRNHLIQLGLKEDQEVLESAERELGKIHKKIDKLNNEVFQKHYDKISPLLRPCHKKRGKELKVDAG